MTRSPFASVARNTFCCCGSVAAAAPKVMEPAKTPTSAASHARPRRQNRQLLRAELVPPVCDLAVTYVPASNV